MTIGQVAVTYHLVVVVSGCASDPSHERTFYVRVDGAPMTLAPPRIERAEKEKT